MEGKQETERRNEAASRHQPAHSDTNIVLGAVSQHFEEEGGEDAPLESEAVGQPIVPKRSGKAKLCVTSITLALVIVLAVIIYVVTNNRHPASQ